MDFAKVPGTSSGTSKTTLATMGSIVFSLDPSNFDKLVDSLAKAGVAIPKEGTVEGFLEV
eukprot:scaffold32026_cov40-Cyclotella_meneghiniana.AAC.1